MVPLPAGGFELHTDPGCSWACDATDLRLWQAFRLGIVLPELRIARTERSRRYAAGALRKAVERVERNPQAVNREAFSVGRLLPAAAIEPEAVAPILADAAGIDPASVLPGLRAGALHPWSPR